MASTVTFEEGQAEHEADKHDALVQTDEMIERDRVGRAIVAFLSPFAFLLLGYFCGTFITLWLDIPSIFGRLIGLPLGAYAAVWAFSRSTIDNGVLEAFVTTNPLASLFNLNPLVAYGPSKHWCYWWESRAKEDTVNLSEVSEPFMAEVQLIKGKLTVKGSTRLRPDITRLTVFIGGAAAVASDIVALIKSFIVQKTSKSLNEALTGMGRLNKKLELEFKHGATQGKSVTAFEKRFAVVVGDTTIEEVLPSKEVQETMSAVMESELIDQIVANSFACENVAELEKAIQGKRIPREEANRRRTQTLAVSGNLQGMDLKDHNINFQISGLDKIDPALIQGIAAAVPVLLAVKQASQGPKTQPQKKGGSK